jgi:hypothetical protein
MTMMAHAHTTALGTHIGIGQATQGWYTQVKTWLAGRHDTKLATLNAHWDARHETVRPFRADAAIDMVASAHARSTTTAFCDLGV